MNIHMLCDKCHTNKTIYFTHLTTPTPICVCFDCMYDIDEFWWKKYKWPKAWWRTFELLYDWPTISEDYQIYEDLIDQLFDNRDEIVLELEDADDRNNKHHMK